MGTSLRFPLEGTVFANREIILNDIYFSSEKVSITKAEFLRDTNTLNLEWIPSESEYATGYFVFILKNPDDIDFGNYPIYPRIGAYYVQGDNKSSKIITSREVMGLFDEDIISANVYIGISATYQIGNYLFNSHCSDVVSMRIYW